jgi:hypothetical protein
LLRAPEITLSALLVYIPATMNIYYTNPQFIKLPNELQNKICSYLPPHPITNESLCDYYIPSMYKLEKLFTKNKKILVQEYIEKRKYTL